MTSYLFWVCGYWLFSTIGKRMMNGMISCLVCLMKHRAILYDKDCQQASSRCLPCGRMPSGCWFVMQEVSPRLPICKRIDGSIPWGWQLGECEILQAGDVYNWLDSLQKVLLPLLALSLCRLGTLFWAIPLQTAVANKLLSAKGTFSCLSHLTPFLCGFTINFMQTATEWTFVNHRQSLSTHSTMSRSSNEVTSLLFPLVHQSTVVHSCQPLSTLSTRWQNKSPQNSPR